MTKNERVEWTLKFLVSTIEVVVIPTCVTVVTILLFGIALYIVLYAPGPLKTTAGVWIACGALSSFVLKKILEDLL